MRRLSTSKLFKKPLLFMLVVFGVLATSTSVIFGWQLYHLLAMEYENKAEAVASTIATSDIEQVLEADSATVQSRIDQYLAMEGVSYVLVTDGAGDVIAHTFVPVIPPQVRRLAEDAVRPPDEAQADDADRSRVTRLHLTGGQNVLHVTQPILQGLGGYVHIGMDESLIEKYVSKGVLIQQGTTLLIFLTSCVIAYLFMNTISKPLLRLADYAKRVAAHDFSAEIDIDSDDEIGVLANAMRSMSEDISKLITGLEQAVKDATTELKDTLASLSAIIRNMGDGLLVTDDEGVVTQHNPALLDMFGLKQREVFFRGVGEVFGPEIAELTVGGKDAMDAGEYVLRNHEVRVTRADGRELFLDVTVSSVDLEGSRVAIAILRDITDRKHAEEALRKAHAELETMVEERTRELKRANIQLKIEVAERKVVGDALKKAEEKYRSIFENAVEGIFQSSLEGRFISANPALARIFGFAGPEDLIAAMHDLDNQLYTEEGRRQEFLDAILESGKVTNFESRVRRRDGRTIWISENARLVRSRSGEPLFVEGSVEDITLRKEAERQLMHQAFHDPLTNLPNRLLFQDHLQLALERSKRRTDYMFSVLYMDLDRFKIINDSLGHDTGDELLKSVARALERCARSMDTVARFGGDEFAVLLEEIVAPRDAIRIARRIQEEISKPLVLQGHEVITSASIGIVLTCEGYDRPEAVLRDADTAMYRAKELGKSRFKVFNQKMHEQALRLMELETDLRKAVDQQEFYLVYQPIVRLDDSSIAGFEVLLRWEHSTHGMIQPDEFIPVAEDTGLIYPIDQNVLRTACATISDWIRDYPESFSGEDALSVNVNISGKHFQRPLLIGQVEQALEETDLAPRFLNLEITESALMASPAISEEMVVKFRDLGLGICVDDFGTGYSSLSYLQRFPIDAIKIDRSFVSEVEHDQDSRAIVKTILSLGRSLGIKVVAEGVETESQLAFLRESGCLLAQGYLYSRPVTREIAESYLRQGRLDILR